MKQSHHSKSQPVLGYFALSTNLLMECRCGEKISRLIHKTVKENKGLLRLWINNVLCALFLPRPVPWLRQTNWLSLTRFTPAASDG